VVNLAENIRKPKSVWELQGLTSPGYFKQIMADPGYAERFTRMLYRLHLRFAENIASSLDLQGVIRLMDLGGGSGVVSMALLRRYPLLKSVVVDVENVCLAGRRIAVDNHLERRITYHPADFQQDELPEGFDRVLYCDVGVYDEALFRRIHKTLNPGGHLVIVGRFATDPARGIPSTLVWGFLGSLEYPSGFVHFATLESIQEQLRNAGFSGIISYSLPAQEVLRWEEEWSIVEACKTASECI
jgi:cyclopropane fatty-acyl-phospholipid synthase-like methyltransferase